MSWTKNENGQWVFEVSANEKYQDAYFRCLETLDDLSPANGTPIQIEEYAWLWTLHFLAAAIAQALNDPEGPLLPLDSLRVAKQETSPAHQKNNHE